MRVLIALIAAFVLLTPRMAAAASSFSCSQIPDAQRFIDTLRPGPNTSAAQRHLDAASNATSDKECIAELRQVDKYARRSAGADKRLASAEARHVKCADWLHQSRPGGTDYFGPPVPGCPQR